MMCWDKNLKIQYCVGIISLPRLLLCNGVPMCGCKPPNFPTMMCNESVMVVRIWKLHSMRIFVPYLITLLWTNWIWGTTPSSPASLHHTCALSVITWSRVIILPGFLPKREYWTLSRADISVMTLRRMLDNCSGTDFSWKEMLERDIHLVLCRENGSLFFLLFVYECVKVCVDVQYYPLSNNFPSSKSHMFTNWYYMTCSHTHRLTHRDSFEAPISAQQCDGDDICGVVTGQNR